MSIVGSKKEEALNLRRAGLSYNDISSQLKIAKSTLSSWFRQYPELSSIKSKNVAASKKIWSANITSYNKLRAKQYLKNRLQEIDRYAAEIGTITAKDLFVMGMSLYLAEGGKSEKHNLRFANADPAILIIFLRFLREVVHTDERKIFARIHYHDQCRYDDALKYWSEITFIKKSNFWNPQLVISSSSKRTKPVNKLPFGTLHLTVCDTSINKKVYGWMQGIRLQFLPR